MRWGKVILVGIVDMFKYYCGVLGELYNRVNGCCGIKYPLGYKTGCKNARDEMFIIYNL
jgi:hypothetical protein